MIVSFSDIAHQGCFWDRRPATRWQHLMPSCRRDDAVRFWRFGCITLAGLIQDTSSTGIHSCDRLQLMASILLLQNPLEKIA